MSPGVDDLLTAARARVGHRPSPAEAQAAQRDGALLVDIRPVEQRQRDGGVPGAVVIERNVLEWRLDLLGVFHRPASSATAPHAVVSVVYRAMVTGGEIQVQPHEVLAAQWWPIDDVPSWHLDDVPSWHLDHEDKARSLLA